MAPGTKSRISFHTLIFSDSCNLYPVKKIVPYANKNEKEEFDVKKKGKREMEERERETRGRKGKIHAHVYREGTCTWMYNFMA